MLLLLVTRFQDIFAQFECQRVFGAASRRYSFSNERVMRVEFELSGGSFQAALSSANG